MMTYKEILYRMMWAFTIVIIAMFIFLGIRECEKGEKIDETETIL